MIIIFLCIVALILLFSILKEPVINMDDYDQWIVDHPTEYSEKAVKDVKNRV